jgi:hypothetical protein
VPSVGTRPAKTADSFELFESNVDGGRHMYMFSGATIKFSVLENNGMVEVTCMYSGVTLKFLFGQGRERGMGGAGRGGVTLESVPVGKG